jgi:Formin Homology 2 Domain.
LTPQQIIGIMEYIPTEDERRSLGNYMRSGRDSSTLCECEKFMLAIMPVQAAKKKLEAMLFKLQYPNSVKQLYQGMTTLL